MRSIWASMLRAGLGPGRRLRFEHGYGASPVLAPLPCFARPALQPLAARQLSTGAPEHGAIASQVLRAVGDWAGPVAPR